MSNGTDAQHNAEAFNADERIAELETKLADYDNAMKCTLDEEYGADQKHCGCVPFLRKRIKELETKLIESLHRPTFRPNGRAYNKKRWPSYVSEMQKDMSGFIHERNQLRAENAKYVKGLNKIIALKERTTTGISGLEYHGDEYNRALEECQDIAREVLPESETE